MLTPKQIRDLLLRAHLATADRFPDDDALHERLIAVEQALLMVMEERNYVDDWLAQVDGGYQNWRRNHRAISEGKGVKP